MHRNLVSFQFATYVKAVERLQTGGSQVDVRLVSIENVLQRSMEERVKLDEVGAIQCGLLQCCKDRLPNVISEIIYILQIINEVRVG